MLDQNRAQSVSAALLKFSAADLTAEKVLQDINLDELIVLSLDMTVDSRVTFRAAWALEHILLHHLDWLSDKASALITGYDSLENWSCLRSYTKLIMKLLSLYNSKQIQLTERDQELILQKTFTILEDQDCPIAVKVNAFDILFDLSPHYEWVAQELKLIIQFNLEKSETAALKSRGLRLLKRLERIP